MAALGEPAGKRHLARLTLDQAAEQVGASDSAGVAELGCAGAQALANELELGLGDDGGERLLHPDGFALVLGVRAPDQCARVRLVGEDIVDAGPGPELSPGAGDALFVEGADDFERPVSGLRHVEHALDDGGHIRVDLQGGSLLGTVLHHDPVVAVGGMAGNPEASRCGLAHPSRDLLSEILAVELVHALDDGLHELARRCVVGVLGDGHNPDALAPEHGLEGDGVLALAGEPGELPDEDFLEGGNRPRSLVDHLAELRPVGDTAALGLVDELAGDQVAVLLGVVPERPELGGNGQVHVLPVAGDSGVEGRWRVVVSFNHRFLLLVSSCSAWRERRMCIRSCLRHSLSSR